MEIEIDLVIFVNFKTSYKISYVWANDSVIDLFGKKR